MTGNILEFDSTRCRPPGTGLPWGTPATTATAFPGSPPNLRANVPLEEPTHVSNALVPRPANALIRAGQTEATAIVRSCINGAIQDFYKSHAKDYSPEVLLEVQKIFQQMWGFLRQLNCENQSKRRE